MLYCVAPYSLPDGTHGWIFIYLFILTVNEQVRLQDMRIKLPTKT